KLASDALLGLEAVHRAGIVHRDISPENIMIAREEDGEEHVKIIDLGIAKTGGDDGEEKTKTGMFVGKWKYCSPEHLGMLPDGERIDGRADLYSFGIVLYEMLAGMPPFHSDTPHGFLMMHASERPRALREVNPSVTASPELESLIFRSLEKDRNRRFATAREFATALEKILPSLADQPGAPPPLPVESEVTADATRVGSERMDAATVAAGEAPTLVTQGVARDLARVPEPVAPVAAPVAPRKSRGLLIAAIVVVAIVIAGFFLGRTRVDTPEIVTPKKQVVVATAPGRLGINAFPWANVTSIRNLDNGQAVELASPMITPQPIDLPPGRYEITFMNPAYRNPITRMVDVRAGSEAMIEVQFVDPATASLPDFGGGR
ncbi:MAG TPA: serine/threonine-protein kinase, partial [Thermoanaerobaculia bacterium]|nr:serine/threonine-protein kinase [Thermoanaerobaculia bacterium]